MILEHRPAASFSISFRRSSLKFLLMSGFFQTEWAICLYVPLRSIFPRGSKSSGSFREDSLERQFTLTVTFVAFLTPVFIGETANSRGKPTRLNSNKGVEVEGGGHFFFGVEHESLVSSISSPPGYELSFSFFW